MTTDDSHIPAHTANTVCPIKSQLIHFIHPPFRHKAPLMFEPGHELGLTLVLRFGSVFFRPSPRQTSLEPRRCEIEECVKLNRQEPAGRINEADR